MSKYSEKDYGDAGRKAAKEGKTYKEASNEFEKMYAEDSGSSSKKGKGCLGIILIMAIPAGIVATVLGLALLG